MNRNASLAAAHGRGNAISVVRGATAPSGVEYICFEQSGKQAWIQRALFSPEIQPGAKALTAAGIFIVGSNAKRALGEQVGAVTDFPPLAMMEHTGWSSGAFAYPDGRVFSSGVDQQPPIVFQAGAVNVASRANSVGWRRHVAGLVVGQHLPLFAIMAAFSAPLLSLTPRQGNFGIMFVGPPEEGKTICLNLAASTCGPVHDSAHGRYGLSFNNTANRIEEWLPLYAELPLIVDEMGSHGGARGSSDFRTLMHHIAGADERGRMGDKLTAPRQTRTVFQISSNEGLADLLSRESPWTREAIASRVIEIPVPNSESGVFNAAVPGFATSKEMADAVRDVMIRYHGTAMPAFLKRLVGHRTTNEAALLAGIKRRIDEFSKLPDVRAAGKISSRVLEGVGLIYAAGELAKYYRILPAVADCRASALYCLALHLKQQSLRDPVKMVVNWIKQGRVIDIRKGKLPKMSDEKLDRKGAFIACNRRGATQFWIRSSVFEKEFADATNLLQSWELQQILEKERSSSGNHSTKKKVVREGEKAERVLVFNIPKLERILSR